MGMAFGHGPSVAEPSPPIPKWQREGDLPTYTRAEIAKHTSAETGVWVIFRGGVYDITEFVQNHPGGVEKILTAAGQSVEPFWSFTGSTYSLRHRGAAPAVPKDHVAEILGPLQIGWLDPAGAPGCGAAAQAASDDPYKDEPASPGTEMLWNAMLGGTQHAFGRFLPHASALFYVRNHHPVPKLDESNLRWR